MAVSYPGGFFAGDAGATFRTWGLADGDPCHQHLGSVPIRAGLGLVFPNIYQHRQTSLRLKDSSKEGHQTVLCFLLVDPEIPPVVSTSVVPPQQVDWIRNAVDESLGNRIPVELIELIMENVEGLMTDSVAQVFKHEILTERVKFQWRNNSNHFCIPFNVWNSSQLPP
jgi:Protein of unknown function (DUF4246)